MKKKIDNKEPTVDNGDSVVRDSKNANLPCDAKNLGHRSRIKHKFAISSKSIMDYELLEMLLFYVFKRKDTKSLSKDLLLKFQTLRGVLFADNNDLKKIVGVSSATILFMNVIKELFSRMLFDEVKDGVIITSSEQVTKYYEIILGVEKREQIRVMFLNNKSKLIAEEVIQEGTINHAQLYPREIVHKSLNYGASAVIIVHNHPSGDPTPSRSDIVVTKSLKELLIKLDITLLDHVVIGRNASHSLKKLGII